MAKKTEPRARGPYWANHVDVAKRKATAKPKPKAKAKPEADTDAEA